MFARLNKTFDIKYEQGEKQISYGGVISYYDAKLAVNDVLDVIPKRYQSDFYLSLMDIQGEVPPHTDSEITATINFYIEPGNYMTKFFRVKEDATVFQVENQTNGVVFDKKDLQHCGAFITNAGYAWLLDVTQPHSVEATKDITRRKAICLATNKYSYEQVHDMLAETGNL